VASSPAETAPRRQPLRPRKGSPAERPLTAADRKRAVEYIYATARERLDVYAAVVFGLPPAPHHLEWYARWMEALVEDAPPERRRVCLVAPPGSSKSTALSLITVCWYLGRHPDRSVLAITSSDVMASQYASVVASTLLENGEHQRVFPHPDCRPDRTRGWSTDGYYLAGVPSKQKDPSLRFAGFGSSVIGSRCHLLVLDDAVGQETAQSAVGMANARRYTDQSLLSRLHPPGSGGGVLLAISTRWSEQDLVAHLEQAGTEVITYPQLSDAYPWKAELERDAPEQVDAEGRVPLWPARYDLAWVEAERRRLGTAQFELLHMGDPVAVGGGVFRSAAWFKPLPPGFDRDTRDRLLRVSGIDLAWSSREGADYTAVATLGTDVNDPMHRLYCLNLFRRRLDEGELLAQLTEHLLAVQPHAVIVELGAFRVDATQLLIEQLRQQLYGRLRHMPNVYGVRSVTDKVTRSRALAIHAENGLFYCDKTMELWPTAERELLSLPLGANDDIPDALAYATNGALGVALREAQQPGRLLFGPR